MHLKGCLILCSREMSYACSGSHFSPSGLDIKKWISSLFHALISVCNIFILLMRTHLCVAKFKFLKGRKKHVIFFIYIYLCLISIIYVLSNYAHIFVLVIISCRYLSVIRKFPFSLCKNWFFFFLCNFEFCSFTAALFFISWNKVYCILMLNLLFSVESF